MEYLAAATVVLTVLLLLSLVYKPMLYVTIPIALSAALYAYSVVNLMLGYPTSDLRDLEQSFFYMGHWSASPTFLLVTPNGASQPRLYVLDNLSSESHDGLRISEKRAEDGEVVTGIFLEGEFMRHNIDPIELVGPK